MKREDIINKVFTKALLGYDAAEVDFFLDEVVREFDRMRQELDVARLRNKIILDELESLRNAEKAAIQPPEITDEAKADNADNNAEILSENDGEITEKEETTVIAEKTDEDAAKVEETVIAEETYETADTAEEENEEVDRKAESDANSDGNESPKDENIQQKDSSEDDDTCDFTEENHEETQES